MLVLVPAVGEGGGENSGSYFEANTNGEGLPGLFVSGDIRALLGPGVAPLETGRAILLHLNARGRAFPSAIGSFQTSPVHP